MHVEDRHGVDELRGLARKTRDGRVCTRLQALVLAKQGHTAVRTAELCSACRGAWCRSGYGVTTKMDLWACPIDPDAVDPASCPRINNSNSNNGSRRDLDKKTTSAHSVARIFKRPEYLLDSGG